MKRKVLLFGILIGFSYASFAQTINLTKGDSKTFQLKNPSANVANAKWNDNGAGYTNTGLTFSKTYATSGDFTLSVYPVSDLSCNGDVKSYTIHVVDDITTLPEQVSVLSIPDVCPLTTGNPTGGVATVNLTLTGFTLTPTETWSVSYKIGATGTVVSANIINGGTSFTFNASASAEIYVMGFSHGSGAGAKTTSYNDTNAPHASLKVGNAPTIDGIF